MNTFIYQSQTMLINAQKQKFQRLLTPLLMEILDKGVEITIDIDKQKNLLINQIPIGNFERISNFKIDKYKTNLIYQYGDKIRSIDFEEIYNLHKPPRKREIRAIFELQSNGTLKKIYKKVG